MPFSRKRLDFLLDAYCNRKTTEAEEEELFSLIKQNSPAEEAVHEHIQQLIEQFDTRELVPSVNWENVYHQVHQKAVAADAPLLPRRRIPWFRVSAAASIILLLGVSAFYTMKPVAKQAAVAQQPAIATTTDVPPGQSGAILTLSNGKQIVLDSAGNGALLTQGNSQLHNQRGRLRYDNTAATGAATVYNTMTTTKGKQYQLQLSDGSKIWLNAASSVTYPTAFTGSERKISITGEAYFEIAHDAKRPFTVSTNGMEVQVLGTHFNVNAYDDEENTSTTLLEGSVKIINQHTTSLLTPGQQLQLNKQGEIKLVTNAAVQDAVAWKRRFICDEKSRYRQHHAPGSQVVRRGSIL